MSNRKELLLLETSAGSGTRLGRVTALLDDATLVSTASGQSEETMACDLLESSGGEPLVLAEGDTVLFVVPEGGARRGVVLGRVGRLDPPKGEPKTPPDEIVLEAKKGLTLKVGEGSITLREDGRVLIKGRDLVSHARRLNRIRGGSVAIN
jgi:hypothetical protein